MSTVFLLQNQNKLLLSRQREWTDGRDLKCLYITPHKDEAINQKVEVNSKDHTQRIHLLECELNDKRLPAIPVEVMPEPLPDSPKGQQVLIEADDDQLPALESADVEIDEEASVDSETPIAEPASEALSPLESTVYDGSPTLADVPDGELERP